MKSINKFQIFLLCLVFSCSLVSAPAQESLPVREDSPKKNFSNIAEEIDYYLTKASYWEREGCLIVPDIEAYKRLQGLARSHSAMFLSQARQQLTGASVEQTKQLVWILIEAGSEDFHPLSVLFTPQSLKETFAENSAAIASALNYFLNHNSADFNSVYAVESVAAIKYYPAVPNLTKMLDIADYPYHEQTLRALVELDSADEISSFIQLKILEELKANNIIVSTVAGSGETTATQILELVRKLAKNNDAKSAYFKNILQQIIFEPNEKALVELASRGKSERLRGFSVLLLAAYRDETSMKVITKRLRNDESELVRIWAAQSLENYPNAEAVEALIAAYLNDKKENVRLASIQSLGVIGSEKAEAILKEALNDQSKRIRETAKFRLAQISAKRN